MMCDPPHRPHNALETVNSVDDRDGEQQRQEDIEFDETEETTYEDVWLMTPLGTQPSLDSGDNAAFNASVSQRISPSSAATQVRESHDL